MNTKAQRDVQAIVIDLGNGTARPNDLGMLFMRVREHVPNDMVKDVAHSIAHDSRTKGHAFTHTKSLVSGLLDAIQFGGTQSVGPIYPWDKFVGQLARDLAHLGIVLDRPSFVANSALRGFTEQLLDGVQISIPEPRVSQCEFTAHPKGNMTVTFTLAKPVGIVPAGQSLAFNAF